MKTVYIPKGEIIRYESLMMEHLVVHGCLQVSNGIKARTITGQGTISAGTIDLSSCPSITPPLRGRIAPPASAATP